MERGNCPVNLSLSTAGYLAKFTTSASIGVSAMVTIAWMTTAIRPLFDSHSPLTEAEPSVPIMPSNDMRNNKQVLHGNPNGWEGNFFIVDHVLCPGQNFCDTNADERLVWGSLRLVIYCHQAYVTRAFLIGLWKTTADRSGWSSRRLFKILFLSE